MIISLPRLEHVCEVTLNAVSEEGGHAGPSDKQSRGAIPENAGLRPMLGDSISDVALANIHRPRRLPSVPNDVDTRQIQEVSVTKVDREEWTPEISLALVPNKSLDVHGFRRRVAELVRFL
jgi:hypothetical protein